MQVDPRAPELTANDFVVLMNSASLCVLIHDAATKNILWANPAACEMLEFSLTEIRPLKANHMSSPARQYDRAIGRAWLQDAVEKGISHTEWHYRSKSGREIPTDALAVRVELEQGPAVMVQFRDIEREQEIERDLRLTSSYVEALARHTSTVAVVLDVGGAVRFATDSAVDALGVSREELVGQQLAKYCDLVRSGVRVTWSNVVASAHPLGSIRLRLPRSGVESRWLEGTVERLRPETGGGLVMILHDVSDRIQDELRRDRQLRHENYLARYNAMGDMAMAIAHELGQPLAAAGNFLAGVRARLPQEQASAVYGIDSAVRQIERASMIVGSVREFVGHLEQMEQVVDLNDVVEECLYFIRLRADQAGVTVDATLAPGPLPVRCERVLTGQVVLNLCFNAVDEMVECGTRPARIEVRTEPGAGVGVFTVSDRGRGIPPDADPFDRSFTSKEHGSGIGLALSHRIITRQHGEIWAEARADGGSRFGFSLPSAEAAHETGAGGATRGETGARPGRSKENT